MGEYLLRRSDIFVFEQSPELIAHVADFRFSEEHPHAASLKFGDRSLRLRIVGTGTQQGKLAVKLALDHSPGSSEDLEALRNLNQEQELKLITLS